jgi:hypothetical protein
MKGALKMNRSTVSEKFINFSVNECKGSSDLYETLSIKIADDEEMLQLASHAREGQPVPNLFLGVVHYLLVKGSNHPLGKYYQSIRNNVENNDELFNCFKHFCNQKKDKIISLLQTKIVQTNEVRRCAYLYPTFGYSYEQVKKPLALIEIGTSAGLQLYCDQYRYSYDNNETVFGEQCSKVHITAEIKGGNSPVIPKISPPVAKRIGIDLHINDLTDEEDYLWLNALIWPEHMDRRALFEKAATYVKQNPPTLVEGDGVELLPKLVSEISADYAICVFHTHVANQMPLETKKKLLKEIKAIGDNRDIFHVYNNMQDRDLHLDYFINGKEVNKVVGQTDGHGRWFTWQL